MARAAAVAVAMAGAVNFGDLGMYSGGQFIPDGDYIVFHNVIMHQAKDTNGVPRGPVRLGVEVAFFPKEDPAEEKKMTQFYSMGSKADQSFAPNAETGKGIVAIPGAKGQNLNDKTNWSLYLKSLYDSGLPAGIFTNDLTAIDGTHVHVQNVDEPAERSTYASSTSEVAQEPRKNNKIAIITEILENGCPWEGTGGLTAAEASKAPAKTTAKPTAKPAAAAPVAATKVADGEDEDVKTAAISAFADIITKKANGLPALALRTSSFAAVKSAVDEEMASKVIDAYFESEGATDRLNNLLGELGYKQVGVQIKPI